MGKELTGLLYELNPQLLAQRVFGKEPETKAVAVEAVPRPPVLCPGCPHRGFFYTMSKNKNFVVGRRHRLLYPGLCGSSERLGLRGVYGRRLYCGHGHEQGL